MSARQIEILVTVRDQTRRPLERLERNVRKTGMAANNATMNFKDFNRTLFATTAFIGTFGAAFFGLKRTLEAGAEFDRLNSRFETAFGHRGVLLKHIRSFTDVGIDQMQMMKSAMDLQVAGLAADSEQVGRLFAMAAVAAHKSGKQTSDGIKRVTEFMKSGSVQALQYLGVIRNTDARFTSLIEVMKKAGGIVGGTVSMQSKLAFAMKALNNFTKDHMKGFANLGDVITNVNSAFEIFGKTISVFIGKALTPLVVRLTNLIHDATIWFETVAKGNENLMFLTKSVIATTSALGGLILTLGTLVLTTKLLGAIGIGIPMLVGAVASLATVFTIATSGADSLTDRLEQFGAILKGAWQVLDSFNRNTGISKIDKDLHDFLKRRGILEFTMDIGRAAILVKGFFSGMLDGIKFVGKKIVEFFDIIGFNIREIFEADTDVWKNSWISAAEDIGKAFGGLAAVLTPLLLLSGGRKLLSKIPVVGRLFGGGKGAGGGPTGTMTDPLFVADVSRAGAGLLGGGKGGGFFGVPKLFKRLFGRINTRLGKLFGLTSIKIFGELVKDVGRGFRVLGKAIWTGKWRMLPKILGHIGVSFRLLRSAMVPALMGIGKVGLGLAAAGGAGFMFGKILTNTFPQLKRLGDWAYDFVNGQKQKEDFERRTSEAAILEHRNKLRARVGKAPLSMEEHLANIGKSPGVAKTPEGMMSQSAEKTAEMSTATSGSSEARVEEINRMLSSLEKEDNMTKNLEALFKRYFDRGPEGKGKVTAEELEGFKQAYKEALETANLNPVKIAPDPGASKR